MEKWGRALNSDGEKISINKNNSEMSEKVITNHMINCLPRIHISKIYTSDCIKHTDTQTHTNTQCKFPI